MTEKKIIYLDHAAATPVDAEVRATMEPWLTTNYCNPSATYNDAHAARQVIDEARQQVAAVLGCSAMEIVFTSGGTESDNLAILGAARQVGRERDKMEKQDARDTTRGTIIVSAIEHPAVLEPARVLAQQEGFTLKIAPVTHCSQRGPEPGAVSAGLLDIEKFKQLAQEAGQDLILVSVMMANNEIGTIQPVAEATRAAKQAYDRVVVHTDACQAAGFLDLNVARMGVDLLTLNGSKIYGPRGVGILYVKRGVHLQPLMYGGHHEFGLRPGTENTAAIVGFAKALELVESRRRSESAKLRVLRDQLIEGILRSVPSARLNGDRTRRLPNNVNIWFKGVAAETLLFALDEAGVAVSMGSACGAGAVEPSPVLLAIGLNNRQARESLRLTLGCDNDQQQTDEVITILSAAIRKMKKN